MKTKSKAEEEKRGRGRFRGFLRTLIALFIIGLIVIAIGAGCFLQQQQKIIRSLEASIEALKMTTIPLRFVVLSRSDTEISARFKFYNADSREIASFERSWKGSELYIDSLVVPLKTGALVFPVRVFTDAVAPRGGTMLLNYYDFDGMPGIYDSASQDGQKRLMLKELFTKLKASEGLYGTNNTGNPGSRLLNYFGNAVHDIKQLRQFEIGTVYSLVIHSDGGIEIMSE
ncbi:hypothetical protein [Gracilinema caldarium]|uniref:hypothetical protein n=1 Tax=Gracilinema caldarium TaxID=215591 RepID=UPI0026EBEB56|nr:hypothetical protein [Gracilinema caldarium]